MTDRRLLGAAVVVAAMLLSPASALALKPVKVTTCAVSADVTTTSVRSKGSVTLTITGTTGADTIDCSALTSKGGVVINGRGGGDTITGTPYADSITDGVIGPGASTLVFGLGGNDIIRVGWGDISSYSSATVDAGAGDDQVAANGGFVAAFGGDGNDLLELSSAYGAQADGGPGNDTVTGPAAAVDETICAGCFNTLNGGAGDDTIVGGAGRDEIGGGSGLDQMHAGPGNDSITDYGDGAETFDCGDGIDLADDFDGNGVGTDGTVGYLHTTEDDTHTSCEEVRVAASGG